MKEQPLILGPIIAPVGEKAKGFITIDESGAGTLVRAPVMLVNGVHEGPTLVLASGVHGDDLNSIPMIWRIVQRLDAHALYGQVIAVPISNPLALEAGAHLTPEDGKSLSFPGRLDGTISERMSYQLYHLVVRRADYLIDLHGGSINATLAVLASIDASADPRIRSETEAMARAFGPQLIVVHEQKKKGNGMSMAQAACYNSAPGIYIGMGQVGFNDSDTRRGTEGVLNVMRHLKMQAEPVRENNNALLASTELYHYTPYGGGFFPEVAAGDIVSAGDSLGIVADVFGRPVGQILAEVNGIVDAIRNYPAVSTGDWVASVARR